MNVETGYWLIALSVWWSVIFTSELFSVEMSCLDPADGNYNNSQRKIGQLRNSQAGRYNTFSGKCILPPLSSLWSIFSDLTEHHSASHDHWTLTDTSECSSCWICPLPGTTSETRPRLSLLGVNPWSGSANCTELRWRFLQSLRRTTRFTSTRLGHRWSRQ